MHLSYISDLTQHFNMASIQAPAELYRSKRLLYRAPEDSAEDREFIQYSILNDSTIQTMSTMRLKRPQHKASAEDFIKRFQQAILGVLICLPAPNPSENGDTKTGSETKSSIRANHTTESIPIGHLSIFSVQGEDTGHHRNVMMGLSFAEGYRGRGYGGEAVNWALDWAFMHAGFHRMCISAFSFNHNALKLYRKLGFVEEGREREAVRHFRGWHDIINLSMLEHEWEALRGIRSNQSDTIPSSLAEPINQ
jgi:ribosomal protein S18 acetylase RimI-like enzyme